MAWHFSPLYGDFHFSRKVQSLTQVLCEAEGLRSALSSTHEVAPVLYRRTCLEMMFPGPRGDCPQLCFVRLHSQMACTLKKRMFDQGSRRTRKKHGGTSCPRKNYGGTSCSRNDIFRRCSSLFVNFRHFSSHRGSYGTQIIFRQSDVPRLAQN